ncbi:Peptide synthetase [Anaerovibrio sp. JC8]|uniref:condensation domain-containing protein n=1 Tax=Anaerovibrio sp. JC8 TaxID=1240085 RepID=UPI000A0B0E66|nr:condensation domain-containing protein [Anaerovibrio sp. JC8]ORU00673.1 Peptide synthetase [Anaerovibrio sp. JC8]
MGEYIKFPDLSQEDKNAIMQRYDLQEGILNTKIKYVRELSADESDTFSKWDADHPIASVLQTVYKINGKLLPLKFNVAVDRAFEQEDALKTNFIMAGDRMLAVVMNKRNPALEIGYNNFKNLDKDELDSELRKHMEADVRLGFDLKRGQLARLSVFNTAEDEYAIIVTAVEAVTYNFDFRRVFRAALNLPEPPDIERIMANIRGSAGTAAGPIRDYWSKMLTDMPIPAKVPHLRSKARRGMKYSEENYLAHVPRTIMSDLRTKAESNKIMLMSILQTAWGFMLQQTNVSKDISFCLLVPQKKKADGGASPQSLVPVRLQVEEGQTVKDLIMKAFKQFVVSQPYASLGREDIMKLAGQQVASFDHYLNFYDFFTDNKPYSEVVGSADGKIVSQKYLDARDALLELSFRSEENQVVLSAHYNGTDFSQNDVRVLMNHYFLVLQQLLISWNEPFDKFMERLEKRWQIEVEQMEGDGEEPRAVVQDGLSKIKLFQECEQGIIQLFMDEAKIATKFEGDRIAEQEIEGHMVFVLSGKVARSIEIGDGWYNTLDILKENSWVNETVLLSNRKVRVAAEVLTEQAVILTLPLLSLQGILKRSPVLAVNIINHSLHQLEKFQRLWIQS